MIALITSAWIMPGIIFIKATNRKIKQHQKGMKNENNI
tara:strand:- start:420 stop:533 length:114 start_codon:yes stop_codon:yes gene_type:complete